MPLGLPVAIFMLAQTASAAPAYGPKPPAPPPKPPAVKAPTTADSCAALKANADPKIIVVCAQRPQGYRLNPDVMEAKREIRSAGRPTRPGPGAYHDTTRCVVGPEGCQSYGINLIGAALTAAEMAKRLSEGKEIGSMFQTDPHPSEYQLYLEAKHRREAKEAEAAAKAKAKAVADQAQAQPPAAAAH
jgi:hypothetical protein